MRKLLRRWAGWEYRAMTFFSRLMSTGRFLSTILTPANSLGDDCAEKMPLVVKLGGTACSTDGRGNTSLKGDVWVRRTVWWGLGWTCRLWRRNQDGDMWEGSVAQRCWWVVLKFIKIGMVRGRYEVEALKRAVTATRHNKRFDKFYLLQWPGRKYKLDGPWERLLVVWHRVFWKVIRSICFEHSHKSVAVWIIKVVVVANARAYAMIHSDFNLIELLTLKIVHSLLTLHICSVRLCSISITILNGWPDNLVINTQVYENI